MIECGRGSVALSSTSTEVADDTAHLDDDLGHAARRRSTVLWIGGLSAGLLVTLVLAVGLGAVAISPATVARIIGHHLAG